MTSNASNNKRLAKNTLTLYVRMIFSMAVSLYTSRVILNTLGIEDFGIYNVVGGVVTMLSFLNSAMAASTQRFLNFELGTGNLKQLKHVFSMSLSIHILVAIIVFILAETIGLWFLNTQMTIPANRVEAANWVYQFSILAAMATLTQVPYTAAIIAHERMKAYASIGITEVVLRLIIVLALTWILADKLKLFAVLTFLVSLTITLLYRIYCKRHFPECSYKFIRDITLFKTLASFSGWNLFGSIALVINGQGQNILLNLFFCPAINAARGIAFQLNNAVSALVANFQIAVNPQIVKSYAAQEYDYFQSLMFRSAKLSFFLLFILSAPILIETEYILKWWLKIVPDYTATFCQITLLSSLINSFSLPLATGASATGKIRRYQISVGVFELLNIPVCYLLLRMGYDPVSVFCVSLLLVVITLSVRLWLLKTMISLHVKSFIHNVIIKSGIVFIITIFPAILMSHLIEEGLLRFISTIAFTSIVSSTAIIFIGITKNERTFVFSKSNELFKRTKNRLFNENISRNNNI